MSSHSAVSGSVSARLLRLALVSLFVLSSGALPAPSAAGAGVNGLDRGIAAGVATDIDGEQRPSGPGYDLGADECRDAISCVATYTQPPTVAQERP